MNAKDTHETTPMRDASTKRTSGADAPAWSRDEFEAHLDGRPCPFESKLLAA